MSSRPNQILIIAILLLVAALLWREGTLRQAQSDNRVLQQHLDKLNFLQAENEALRAEKTNSLDAKKLRDLESENLRLKSKLTQTRVGQSSPAKKAEKDNAASPREENPPPEERYRSYKAEIQSPVGWRQILVTGGWKTSPGKQSFILVQPEADQANVMMQVRVVEISDDAMRELGLEWETTGERSSALKKVYDEQKSAELVKAFEKTSGVDLLSAPRIISAPGRQAQVKVVDIRTLAPNQTVEVGPIVDLIPHLSADGSGVDLTVGAGLNLLSEP
jgi:hypothetical protein